MRHYQLTPRASLTLNACRPSLKWFAGKTNRLALYSVNLLGLELNLYVERHWAYPIWEKAPALTRAPASIAPSAVHAQSSIVQFRASPARGIPLPPPTHNNY